MDHSKQITKRFGTAYWKIKSKEQQQTENHNHRIYFSYIAFGIAVGWLIFVGFIVYSSFFVEINSSVMIALLTTSTATVIGLPYLVLQGVYKIIQEENKAKILT